MNPSGSTVGTGANGRRSPRIGTCPGSSTRPVFAYAAGRHQGGAPLGDITNVNATRGEKAIPAKALKQQLPPPTVATLAASAAPPSRAPWPSAQAPMPVVEAVAADDMSMTEKAFAPDEFDKMIERAFSVAKQSAVHCSEDDLNIDVLAVEQWIERFCMCHASVEKAQLVVDQLKGYDGKHYLVYCSQVRKVLENPEAFADDLMVNVQNVIEYATDFYDSLFRQETLFLPRADYMDTQTDITGKMRTILIDWMVEVHMKYRLRPETLHLTVNLVDRYLTKISVLRKRLQLVGVVAMFIAAKFEEINPPELHDWVYITDSAYSQEDVLVTECQMLSTLGFQIMVPTAAHFFEGFQKANGCDDVHRQVAQYLLELTLLDMSMLQYKPSLLVAAAMLLSNELLKRCQVWPASMVQTTRYNQAELRSCADDMRRLLENDRTAASAQPGHLQAVHKKFAAPQRHSVSQIAFST